MKKQLFEKMVNKYLDLISEQVVNEKPLDISMVGKHNDVPDDKFDQKELAMGIKIEHEHTNEDEIAKRIAKDHLSEIPDYYTRLEKMESEAEGKK